MIETQPQPNRSVITYPKVLFLSLAIFATITTVLVIADRLSNEALSVLAGATCGVGAAIPTSLLIAAVSNRRAHRHDPQQPYAPYAPQPGQTPYPPFVIVTGQQQPQPYPQLYGNDPLQPPQQPRKFDIIGGGYNEAR